MPNGSTRLVHGIKELLDLQDHTAILANDGSQAFQHCSRDAMIAAVEDPRTPEVVRSLAPLVRSYLSPALPVVVGNGPGRGDLVLPSGRVLDCVQGTKQGGVLSMMLYALAQHYALLDGHFSADPARSLDPAIMTRSLADDTALVAPVDNFLAAPVHPAAPLPHGALPARAYLQHDLSKINISLLNQSKNEFYTPDENDANRLMQHDPTLRRGSFTLANGTLAFGIVHAGIPIGEDAIVIAVLDKTFYPGTY